METSLLQFDPFLGQFSMFSEPLGRRAWSSERQRQSFGGDRPTIDLDFIELADQFVILADLPGVKEDDVDIQINNRSVTLKINKKRFMEECASGGCTEHRIERSYGVSTRTFRLPENCDENSANAVYENGVLQLWLRKINAQPMKKIPLQVK